MDCESGKTRCCTCVLEGIGNNGFLLIHLDNINLNAEECNLYFSETLFFLLGWWQLRLTREQISGRDDTKNYSFSGDHLDHRLLMLMMVRKQLSIRYWR